MAPTAKLAGDAGVMAIEDKVGADVADEVTVRFTDGLVTPDMDAVIVVVPAATPVAKPVEDIAAMVLSELTQVT